MSFFLVPSRSSSTPFYPQSVTSQGECLDSLLFCCFHFKLTFESFKEFGSMLTCLNYLWIRWQYYCPCYEDWNVVPYHYTTLICGVHIWTFNESHLHTDHITFWNIAMKCESQASIKLDDVSVRSLGLVDVTPLQL